MCGIAGFIGAGTRDTLEKMTAAVAHRGPDGAGFHVVVGQGIYLGHRRLAVVDAPGGAQPMGTSVDGHDVTLAFNGEIYNHRPLRAELSARGHRFASDHSDTEVLLRGYVEWGRAVVDHLDGMFSFCVVDQRAGVAFLARDRFGEKPLYWFRRPGCFAFASELRALACHPLAPQAPDPLALQQYLTFGYVPSPRTPVAGLMKLPPAHTLTVSLHALTVETRRYWAWSPAPDEGLARAGAVEVASEIRRTLARSVADRLVADVPVGLFLSGGVDSSLVGALARESASGHSGRARLKAFSVGFEAKGYDETAEATAMARHIGLEPVVETLRDADAAALVAEVGAALDEPVADSSLIPTWALSRLARRHVTVALSGDGGDELFCGYPTFLVTAALAGPLGAVASAAARSAVGDALRALPFGEGTGYMGWGFRAQRLLRGLGHDPATRDMAFLGPLDDGALRELLGGGLDTVAFGEALYEGPRALYDETAGWHPVDRAAAFYIRFYLAESVLPKVDRMSMAHALEVRAPFLSNEMVALASRIPWRMKLRGVTTKAVLRDAAAPLLPRGLAMRPKHGFAAPVALWARQGRLPIRWASLEARLATTLPPGAIAALRARAAFERGLATALWALGAAG